MIFKYMWIAATVCLVVLVVFFTVRRHLSGSRHWPAIKRAAWAVGSLGAIMLALCLIDIAAPPRSERDMTVTVTAKEITTRTTTGRKAYQRRTYRHYNVWFRADDGTRGQFDAGTPDTYLRCRKGRKVSVTQTVRVFGDTVYTINRDSR